ncbi:hypothetical protein [Pseudomonas aeruginosa]|uniref:hypothetical protein n=1 Tax=Pseudomonas aeruginosa TaxID=287 RepID=UPI00044CA6F9|nr:hypothetical protein [Pseudomonas aeruginosa]EKV4554263.1 hypothetical protein [Pseudomonas aeruginosa]EKX9349107.1 hypothetical protein [Pseudomonas aeruginosa]ELK6184664.1 hypothetical protein [Pseudomonas aeruginosa]ETV01452.1 hypothetical protein Q051_03739 [Pseudomonas aeruginosa BWHPSA046]EZO23893.1 hypothetical protein AJ63_00505 [Pseudomonas aeruginosa 3576]
MTKSARRVPDELRDFLTKDHPKSQERVILAFDNLCREFMEDWEGPETYQIYINKQLELIVTGKFTPDKIVSNESATQNKASNGTKSLTHHLMLALTYRLLAEDLEEEGLIFEANQAITSATLHLGACIPSLFIELGKNIDISEKNSSTAVKRHQKSRRSMEHFSSLIRDLAPQDGWSSRKHILKNTTPKLIEFEREIGLKLKGDIDTRLMRWMRDEEAPRQAANETLKKRLKNHLSE